MEKYYKGALGEIILETEKSVLNNYLEKIFGYHVLQLGGWQNTNFLNHSPIAHKIYFSSGNVNNLYNSNVQGDFIDLPFLENSIDLVIIPHSFADIGNAEEILNEVYRILIGEGHLIIVGINPFSLLGVANKLKLTDIIESKTKLIRMGRMINWLHRFGFEIVESKTFFFRPPIKNDAVLKKMVFMEIAGQMLLPKMGGVYILVAKKRVVSLTPIRHYALKKRKFAIVSSSARYL